LNVCIRDGEEREKRRKLQKSKKANPKSEPESAKFKRGYLRLGKVDNLNVQSTKTGLSNHNSDGLIFTSWTSMMCSSQEHVHREQKRRRFLRRAGCSEGACLCRAASS